MDRSAHGARHRDPRRVGQPVCSQGATASREWLAHPKRARGHLHFTPTSSSWLNLVEGWFKLLTERRRRRGTFNSVGQLIDAVDLWVEHWNDDPHPFIWKKPAQEILADVKRGRATLTHQINSAAPRGTRRPSRAGLVVASSPRIGARTRKMKPGETPCSRPLDSFRQRVERLPTERAWCDRPPAMASLACLGSRQQRRRRCPRPTPCHPAAGSPVPPVRGSPKEPAPRSPARCSHTSRPQRGDGADRPVSRAVIVTPRPSRVQTNPWTGASLASSPGSW